MIFAIKCTEKDFILKVHYKFGGFTLNHLVRGQTNIKLFTIINIEKNYLKWIK